MLFMVALGGFASAQGRCGYRAHRYGGYNAYHNYPRYYSVADRDDHDGYYHGGGYYYRVNREYDARIWRVRHDYRLAPWEKRRIIWRLNQEREERLSAARWHRGPARGSYVEVRARF